MDLMPEAPDKDIRKHVYRIENIIKKQLSYGLRHRRPFFDEVRKPFMELILRNKNL